MVLLVQALADIVGHQLLHVLFILRACAQKAAARYLAAGVHDRPAHIGLAALAPRQRLFIARAYPVGAGGTTKAVDGGISQVGAVARVQVAIILMHAGAQGAIALQHGACVPGFCPLGLVIRVQLGPLGPGDRVAFVFKGSVTGLGHHLRKPLHQRGCVTHCVGQARKSCLKFGSVELDFNFHDAYPY